MFWKKEKYKINHRLLKKYPCDSYLRHALYFINVGKSDVAYTEICYAIMKGGGKLSDEEMKKFKELIEN